MQNHLYLIDFPLNLAERINSLRIWIIPHNILHRWDIKFIICFDEIPIPTHLLEEPIEGFLQSSIDDSLLRIFSFNECIRRNSMVQWCQYVDKIIFMLHNMSTSTLDPNEGLSHDEFKRILNSTTTENAHRADFVLTNRDIHLVVSRVLDSN